MSTIAVFDIESLGVSSESVILSAAITFGEIKEKYSVQELIDNTFFVKFSVEDQIKTYKRTVDHETGEWWKKQCDSVKNMSLIPNKQKDLSAKEGIEKFKSYVNSKCTPSETLIFARGSLDQCCFDSLTKQTNEPAIFPYSNWRDVRTTVCLLAEEEKRGYCEVSLEKFPDYNRDMIIKHQPQWDCILDFMMLMSCF